MESTHKKRLNHALSDLSEVPAELAEGSVGYKRPPKHSQFRPGKSGNPGGRPKHARNFRSDLMEELSTPTTVTDGGQTFEVSKQRAVIKTLVAAAIAGNLRAATALLSLCARMWSPDDFEQETSLEELEIVDAFVRRERESRDSSTQAEMPPNLNRERNPDDA